MDTFVMPDDNVSASDDNVANDDIAVANDDSVAVLDDVMETAVSFLPPLIADEPRAREDFDFVNRESHVTENDGNGTEIGICGFETNIRESTGNSRKNQDEIDPDTSVNDHQDSAWSVDNDFEEKEIFRSNASAQNENDDGNNGFVFETSDNIGNNERIGGRKRNITLTNGSTLDIDENRTSVSLTTATEEAGNINATLALKNLHDFVTNVHSTGSDSDSAEINKKRKRFADILPAPASTAASTSASPALFMLQNPSETDHMETIGSKLLLLAAAQSTGAIATAIAGQSSSAKAPTSTISGCTTTLTGAVSYTPSTTVTGHVAKSTPRALLPKPVLPTATTISSLLNSAGGVSKAVPTISNKFQTNSDAQSNSTATNDDLNDFATNVDAASFRYDRTKNNGTERTPYNFVPPPAGLNSLRIPNGGYKCLECGDSYAMKTCLEFHQQRRSVMIEAVCVPCRKTYVFFNKCSYNAHVRHHKEKAVGKQSMPLVFQSVTIKPIVWSLMELWFEDTAFKRMMDPDAFFAYEFGFDQSDEQPLIVFASKKTNGINNNNATSGNQRKKPTAAAPPTSTIRIRCTECAGEFADQSALKHHFMYNLPTNQKQFICTTCHAVYFSHCGFSAHKRTHQTTSQAPHTCPECGYENGSMALLAAHLTSHRTKPTTLDSWRCPKCYTFYSSWDALIVHMAAAHCEMHHCCRACTTAFNTLEAFEEHKRCVHHVDAPAEPVVDYRLLARCCSCSSLGFQSKEALIDHLKKHFTLLTPYKVYRCSMCGRLMENKNGLSSHFKSVHNMTVSAEEIEEDCVNASAHVTANNQQSNNSSASNPNNNNSASALNSNNTTVLQQQPPQQRLSAAGARPRSPPKLLCKLCPRMKFRSHQGLNLHMRLKHPFVVISELQQLAASTNLSANQQQQSVKSPPTFTCNFCQKRFDSLKARFDHGRQHLDEGHLVCLLCKNSFMHNASTLLRHFQKHIDEQQQQHLHQSQGYRGNRNDKSYNGSKAVVDDIVYVCSRHCKQQFYTRAKALNHLRALHQLAEVKCTLCQLDFVDQSELDKHKHMNHVTTSSYASESTNWNCRTSTTMTAASEVSKLAANMVQKMGYSALSESAAVAATPPVSRLGVMQCTKCPARFETANQMREHVIDRHKGAKFYTCLECATNFASPPSLGRHLITAHQIIDLEAYLFENPAALPYKANELECDVCHKEFNTKSSLDVHVRTHGLLFLKTQEKKVD